MTLLYVSTVWLDLYEIKVLLQVADWIVWTQVYTWPPVVQFLTSSVSAIAVPVYYRRRNVMPKRSANALSLNLLHGDKCQRWFEVVNLFDLATRIRIRKL